MRGQIVTGPTDQSTFQHKETPVPRLRVFSLVPSWTNFVPGLAYNVPGSRTGLTLSFGDVIQLEWPDNNRANGFQTSLKHVKSEEVE